MRPQDIARLLLLSTLWGGSFIFMRVAAPSLGAITTAGARVGIAGLALVLYVVATRQDTAWRTRWKQYVVIGFVNSAFPFVLYCWAETRITASMAAILNSTSPLFGAVIAAFWLRDALTVRKVAGMLVALCGVGLLVGWSPSAVDPLAVAACLVASCCYGLAATYTKAKVKGAPPMGLAMGSQIAAFLFLAPLIPFALPHTAPTTAAILCVVALAVVSTAAAYVLYFRLVIDIGPTKALTVTFLSPAFGVIWGAIFLGESITVLKAASAAVVLVGTALVTIPRADRKGLPATA